MTHPKTNLARFMAVLARFILNNRLLALLAVLLVTVVLSSGLLRLKFDTSPESFFLEDASEVQDWHAFKDKYQSDEFSFIILTPPQVDAAFVAGLRKFRDQISDIDGVARVTAIDNVRSITGSADTLDVGDYLNEGLTDAEITKRLAAAPEHPYYNGLFVNKDATQFGVLVETASNFSNADKAQFTAKIRDILSLAEYESWKGIAIGAPILDTDVQTIVGMESGIFGTITFVLVMAGFWVAFRHRIAITLPLVVSSLSIASALGAMGLWGASAGILTPIVPSFLISVGMGTSIYLLSEFTSARHQGVPVQEAIVETMESAGGPELLANITTAGALFAFSGSRVLQVRDVGLTLGVGLTVACFFTLMLFPLLAQFWGHRIAARKDSAVASPILTRLANFALAAPWRIVTIFVVLVGIAVLGLMKLNTDYYYLGTFKQSSELFQNNQKANDAIPVSNSIEVLVSLGKTDALKDPAALRAIDTLTKGALASVADDVAVKAYSLADIVKELSEQTLGSYTIPDDQATIAQLILLFESSGSDELQRVSNADYEEARLTFLIPSRPYSAYKPLVEFVETQTGPLLAQAGYPEAKVIVTGVVPMWMRISTFLTETQFRSFLWAALVVAVVMVLIVRSLAIGLAMSLVNIGCVILVLGFMGHWGITLDPFTILIGAIALGILDDDTIHFARSFLDRRKEGAATDVAVHTTFQSAGKAMGLQTLILVIAFLVYTTGSVQSLATFGLITTVTIFLGLVVEYTVTHALLVLMTRSRANRRATDLPPFGNPVDYRPVD